MHNLTKVRLFRFLLAVTYPFALILLYPAALMKRKKTGRHFFFFDRYVIGGAQRIHLDILQSIEHLPKQVYFTRYSPNDKLKSSFYSIPNSACLDIHTWCDYLIFRPFTVHYYAFYINRHKDPFIFSGNSTFFYDMLPYLKGTKVELLHNFTHGKSGMEFFGLANHRFLDYRAVYDNFTLANIKTQYREYKVPDTYLKRLVFIEPGVTIPPTQPAKDMELPLKVLYAGRGGPQKRIHLLDRIAKMAIERKLPVEFHFAGTMTDELSEHVKKHSVIHGEVRTIEEMYKIYRDCHVILMTSAYEGFPMLIKEGMANGCIPLVTALPGNLMHLEHEKNALLIHSPELEELVVAEGLAHLERLAADMNFTSVLSARCFGYARDRFDRMEFLRQYRDFLVSGKTKNTAA